MTAQHITLDLISNGFSAFSLSGVSELTALSNDFSFDKSISIFLTRRLPSCKGVLFLSVSGNSNNLIEAAETANLAGLNTLAITGYGGTGKLNQVCTYAISVNSRNYQLVEALHHLLLAAVVYDLQSRGKQ
jgi:D-sedoheptulose 7-phosphate isomerase